MREWIRADGGTFSEHAAETGWFNPDYVALVGAGEQSASVTGSFDIVADEDDEDVDNAPDSLSALLEPILVGLLGLVVAVIVGTALRIDLLRSSGRSSNEIIFLGRDART
jgi:type II secretory pathway component PulF